MSFAFLPSYSFQRIWWVRPDSYGFKFRHLFKFIEISSCLKIETNMLWPFLVHEARYTI